MDIIFENLGFIIFLVFFILPAVKRLKQKKKEGEGLQAKKAGGKPAGPSRAADDETRARTSRPGLKGEKSRQLRKVLDKAGVSEGLAGLEKALKQGWEELSGETEKRPGVGEPVSSSIPLKKGEPQVPVQEIKTLVAEMEDQAAAAREAVLSAEGTSEVSAAPTPVRRYGHQETVSPLARIGAMSPLKQAVVWKEILDTPRGLS
jgi:flagellar motility protein MotE (MotC chaperone)